MGVNGAVGAGIEIQTLAVAFSNGCDRWMARRTPESRVGGRAIRDKRGKMRTLRSLEALPASSRTSAVRYSVVIGMGRGSRSASRFGFSGARASSKFPDFRAGRGKALHVGDVRTKDGSGVDGGGGADAAAGGSAVLLVGTGIEGGTEVSVRFAKVAVGGGHTNLFPEPPAAS